MDDLSGLPREKRIEAEASEAMTGYESVFDAFRAGARWADDNPDWTGLMKKSNARLSEAVARINSQIKNPQE
jgi:hypothetical protein